MPSLLYKHFGHQKKKTKTCYWHAWFHAEKKQNTTIINISHYDYLKEERRMELNHEKCQCEQGEMVGRVCFGVVAD